MATEVVRLVDQLFAPWRAVKGPGWAVAVTVRGKPLMKRFCGLASVEFGIPIDHRTRFRIASLYEAIYGGGDPASGGTRATESDR